MRQLASEGPRSQERRAARRTRTLQKEQQRRATHLRQRKAIAGTSKDDCEDVRALAFIANDFSRGAPDLSWWSLFGFHEGPSRYGVDLRGKGILDRVVGLSVVGGLIPVIPESEQGASSTSEA